MAVQVLGIGEEVDGYGDSMEEFRKTHEANTAVLLNLTEGKKKNEPRPAYDPLHRDNQWPVMVYHPEKGEKVVGKSLKGVVETKDKDAIERANNAALQDAKKQGYRSEPYPKPQIAVLSPEAEKKAQADENARLKGQLVAMEDRFNKLIAKLEGEPAKEDAPKT